MRKRILKDINHAVIEKNYFKGLQLVMQLTESGKGWEKYLESKEIQSLFNEINKLDNFNKSFARHQIEDAQISLGYPLSIEDSIIPNYNGFYIEHMPIEEIYKMINKLNVNPSHAIGYSVLFKPFPQDMGNVKITVYASDLKGQIEYFKTLASI